MLHCVLIISSSQVFTRPPDQIIAAVHLPAGMFLVIGAVSGAAIFLKVD